VRPEPKFVTVKKNSSRSLRLKSCFVFGAVLSHCRLCFPAAYGMPGNDGYHGTGMLWQMGRIEFSQMEQK
jgi:hypothetical protein